MVNLFVIMMASKWQPILLRHELHVLLDARWSLAIVCVDAAHHCVGSLCSFSTHLLTSALCHHAIAHLLDH